MGVLRENLGTIAGKLVIAAVIGATALLGQTPAFEVASVKPSGAARSASGGAPNNPGTFSQRRTTLKLLVALAYGVPDFQVSGGPSWVDTEGFDIDAKASAAATRPEILQMLATLLADRFELTVHREPKIIPVYALVVAKGGPKLGPQFHPAKEGEPRPTRPEGGLGVRNSMKQLASILTLYHKMPFPSGGEAPLVEPEPYPVVDQTGLEGDYDTVLHLRENRDWFVVLNEQLGLKLELRKIPMEMVVIDKASKPTGN